MQPDGNPRRGGSFGFGIVLVAVGIVLLILNWRPNFDPWPYVWRYWPVALIVLGLGKLYDHMRRKNNPQAGGSGWISGGAIAVLVIVGVLGFAVHTTHISYSRNTLHETQSVEKQGAQSVVAHIDMPAGQLTIGGGSARLLDADFTYGDAEGKPQVDYSASGTTGRVDINQQGGGIHFGNTENNWNLRFGDLPIEMELEMGAGQSDLNLRGIDLTRLRISIGAGETNVDLTGDRKKDLNADIQGGVGQATVRLPRNVGVVIKADGGIGSIDTVGLRLEGGRYVNDAYGKSPVTIHMNIEGGVGEIRLIQEP